MTLAIKPVRTCGFHVPPASEHVHIPSHRDVQFIFTMPEGEMTSLVESTVKPSEGDNRMEKESRVEAANRVQALQRLLQDYRTQHGFVNAIRDELYDLRSNPTRYFENRKTFLFQVFNKRFDKSQNSTTFDVLVHRSGTILI
jgi:hypothetical protein